MYTCTVEKQDKWIYKHIIIDINIWNSRIWRQNFISIKINFITKLGPKNQCAHDLLLFNMEHTVYKYKYFIKLFNLLVKERAVLGLSYILNVIKILRRYYCGFNL